MDKKPVIVAPQYNTFWKRIILGRWKTLKGKFLHAFLNITVAAVLIYIGAMVTLFWLQHHARILAEKDTPMFQAAAGIEIGLQRSLASILGWISVSDQQFLEQYQDAWNNQIWLNYQKLNDLSKRFDERYNLVLLDRIKPKLVKLYNLQWQMVDVAHTVGNNPAYKELYLKVYPVYANLIGVIRGVNSIQTMSESVNHSEPSRLLNQLIDNVSLSLFTLQNFTLNGRTIEGNEFEAYLKNASNIYRSYQFIQNASGLKTWFRSEKEHLDHVLSLEFIAFQKLTSKVQKQVNMGNLNIAEKLLREQAIPLEREVSVILLDMVSHQQEVMKREREAVSWISLLAPWVMVLLIVILLVIAILLAVLGAMQLVRPIANLSEATKKLAVHELEEDIPITSEDEMGQLTISFNDMRASLLASEEQTENLLLNMLPKSIVKRLREGEKVIVDQLDDVSIVFIDIVKFTDLVSNISPKALIDFLSRLFTGFDHLVVKHKIEKIKTIGDAYMVAGGATDPDINHLSHSIEFALDALKMVKQFNLKYKMDLQLRIGIHCGPVTAGVIGQKRFTYDLWGDTVNIASRMESHGIPETIQVSEAVYQQLKDHYPFEPRGEISIKGKLGAFKVYLLKP